VVSVMSRAMTTTSKDVEVQDMLAHSCWMDSLLYGTVMQRLRKMDNRTLAIFTDVEMRRLLLSLLVDKYCLEEV
jgi:hypothetical protein